MLKIRSSKLKCAKHPRFNGRTLYRASCYPCQVIWRVRRELEDAARVFGAPTLRERPRIADPQPTGEGQRKPVDGWPSEGQDAEKANPPR